MGGGGGAGSPPSGCSFNAGDGEGAGRRVAIADVEDEAAELTREDRLRMMITQDQNVENLLMGIRRSEMQTLQATEREKNWESEHPTSSRFVLAPGSKIKAHWDVAMLCLVLASAIMMPLDLAFDIGRAPVPLTIMVVLDVSFLFDLLLSFRVAYAEEHLVIRQPRYIFKKWFRGWFFFDIVAALPLEVLNVIASLPTVWYADAFKLLRIVRLIKLPRVLRDNQQWQRMRLEMNASTVHLVSGLGSLLYTSHLLGCICTRRGSRTGDLWSIPDSP